MKKLIFATVAGCLVTLGVWLYLRHEEKKISEHFTLTTVLSAKKYVGNGKPLTLDMVEEIQLPTAYLPPGAFQRKADLLDAKNAPRFKARIGILKGEVISKSRLADISSEVGLAWLLQPEEVAYSLRLESPAAVAGLIQPGDWVHLLSSIGEKSRILIRRARVAAVGDHVWNPAGAAVNETSKLGTGDAILVTLILTPRQALLASLAGSQGNLALALASPLEGESAVLETVHLKNLTQGEK